MLLSVLVPLILLVTAFGALWLLIDELVANADQVKLYWKRLRYELERWWNDPYQ
jgi:hypothetical protein